MKMHALISIFLISILAPLATAQFIKQQHSLVGPFESATMEDWFLAGSAEVTPNLIHLTNDAPHNQGSIWNIHPCNSPDWEIQVHFLVHGKGHETYGDGIGIWYVKDPMHIGPVFGSKDFFSGLGIFIDTFQNPNKPHKHPHPYISAMVNNGSVSYAHDEDGTYLEVGSCQTEVRNKQHITRIAVSYIEDTLTVYLDTEGIGQWAPCFRTQGVYLPTGYHFGISASTYDMSDNHDIVSITALEFSIPRQEVGHRALITPYAEHFKIPKEEDTQAKQNLEQELKPKKAKDKKVKAVKEEKVEVKKQKAEEVKKQKAEEVQKQKAEEVKKQKAEEVKKQKAEEVKKQKVEDAKKVKEAKQKVKEKIDVKTEQKPKAEKVVYEKVEESVFKEKIEHEDGKKSLLTKFVYIIGAMIIITIAISTCRKYFARRKEMMQKRLY